MWPLEGPPAEGLLVSVPVGLCVLAFSLAGHKADAGETGTGLWRIRSHLRIHRGFDFVSLRRIGALIFVSSEAHFFSPTFSLAPPLAETRQLSWVLPFYTI